MNAVEVERQPVHRIGSQSDAATQRRAARHSILWLPTTALIVGLIITGVLAALSHEVYVRNEHRLLRLRARDVSAVLTAVLPGIQTPLASAAELGDATGGSRRKFRVFAAPYVHSGQFASMSIWNLHDPGHGPVEVVGQPPQLAASMSRAPRFFARVERARSLSVIGLLNSSSPRLGYGYSTPGLPGGYAAYAESALPRNRYSPLQRNSAFTGLLFALYLKRAVPAELLATNVRHLPLTGHVATQRVPFGDAAFVLRLSAAGSLAGSLPQELPWIIAIAGTVLSLAAAATALRLTQGRHRAMRLASDLETVAGENRRLYSEQRTIARTLQHALLPAELPQAQGLEVRGRYEPGERTMDIGGDWYDVITLDDGCLLLIVGDVSGRGLKAGTTMASLRFAIHAYAVQHDPPEVILSKLSRLLSVNRDGQLATILCAKIDVSRRRLTLTSAGHLPALMVAAGEGRFLEVPIGLPVGVDPATTYGSSTVEVPPGATVLAFTDGLVERRGEHLDEGLARLRRAAERSQVALPELLSKLVADFSSGVAKDDIAIVGLRWTN